VSENSRDLKAITIEETT